MRTCTPLKQALFAKQGETPRPVALPHTWNALDGQDGGADYWRGLGLYEMALPDPTPGKRQYIEFGAANHIATVFCNGQELGTHRGGFSAFRYELTRNLKPTGNVLTVAVNNGVSEVYPQNADFTFFGGLYREVRFLEVEQAHFDLLLDGTGGVFVTAHAGGTTRIDLFPVDAEGCSVGVELLDGDGNCVASGEAPAQPHTVLKLTVPSPHLWNGVADPYCYTCRAKLLRGEETADALSVTYGYRSFHVDPQTGFYLNGKSCPLHGVSRHQDKENQGWVLTPEDHEADLRLIAEMGANSLRLVHYQHDSCVYEMCSRMGLVVWSEIPFITERMPGQAAEENVLSQLRELIAQNYNHPCVVFWDYANEITAVTGETEELYGTLCRLQALCKQLDPGRLTAIASVSMVPMNSEHVYLSDVVGFNHYFGWYGGEVEDNGVWIDRFHAMNPDRSLGITEYGVENLLQWHSAAPENHDYTEEYANYYHHAMLKTFAQRPFLWGTYVWCMFDFAADARNEGGMQGRNNKGLVTCDRKIKKDAYYLYQAYWSEKPVLYVAGGRFTDRAPGERTVTVYTNCPEVTLEVNGQPVGVRKAADHAAVFEQIPLLPGENSVRAVAGTLVSNTVCLRGVEEHNYAYDLPDGNQGANWFDDPEQVALVKAFRYPRGFYSIKDKIGTLMADPRTAQVMDRLKDLIEFAMAGAGSEIDMDNLNPQMEEFIYSMRLVDMLKTAGDRMTLSQRLQLNEELNAIAKTR